MFRTRLLDSLRPLFYVQFFEIYSHLEQFLFYQNLFWQNALTHIWKAIKDHIFIDSLQQILKYLFIIFWVQSDNPKVRYFGILYQVRRIPFQLLVH